MNNSIPYLGQHGYGVEPHSSFFTKKILIILGIILAVIGLFGYLIYMFQKSKKQDIPSPKFIPPQTTNSPTLPPPIHTNFKSYTDNNGKTWTPGLMTAEQKAAFIKQYPNFPI